MVHSIASMSQKEPEKLHLTDDLFWPPHLRYWRDLTPLEIREAAGDDTPLLVVWGVLESHGPYLPVANDSHMASLAADEVAYRLVKEQNSTPIIFNSFIDIGSPSATWEFPGAVAFTSQPVPVIQEMWEQTLVRLVEKEGFRKIFLVNGDGGNWMNHWARLQWDSEVVRRLRKEYGLVFTGSNWDQDGGDPFLHGGTHEHAFVRWAYDFAPDRIRASARRHGIRPAPEKKLRKLNGTKMSYLEEEAYRFTDWNQYPGQDKLLGVVEFDWGLYRNLLYLPGGGVRKNGGIAEDFAQKIRALMKKVTAAFRDTR